MRKKIKPGAKIMLEDHVNGVFSSHLEKADDCMYTAEIMGRQAVRHNKNGWEFIHTVMPELKGRRATYSREGKFIVIED